MLRMPLAMLLLGAIALPAHGDDAPIATVTVTANKATVVRKLDKTVHDVSGLARAEHGTAQDVLQSTPGIAVTADGQLTVHGNSQVTVLVDGKPAAALSGDERAVALQTMSGADIASVEVVTNPSAAHQANGGAIVNIVLKRDRKRGAHAQVRGSVADRGLWQTGVSGDIGGKRSSVRGEVAVRHDGTHKLRRSAVGWDDPAGGPGRHALQTSDVFVRRIVHSAALDIDYDVSATDSIGLSARHNARRSRPVLDTLNVVGDSVYHRISHGPNEQADGSASLQYSHQDNGSALKAFLQRSDTDTLVDKSFSDIYAAPPRATGTGRAVTRSARRLDQATVDWSRKTSSGQWGIGVDLQDERHDLANYLASVAAGTGAETPDSATTNGYAVATTQAAAYVTALFTRGKWEFQPGGRYERMTQRVRPDADGTHRQAFNPSLHARYAASASTDLTFSYRRSSQRPDPRDLNPFATYVDAQNLSRGNPDLRPQRVAAWEIGIDVTAGRLSGSATAFHRASRDIVADARGMAGDVVVTSKQNGGEARSTGITGALDWSADAIHLGLDGGAWRAALRTPDPAGMVRQHGIAGYLNASAGYCAGIDDVSLDAHFQSATMTPLVRHGPTSSVNATWKRRLTRTLSLTVNASDIFDGSRRTYRTATIGFRQDGFEHFVARRLQVGFVQKFE